MAPFPAVGMIDPRQVGKTTLAKQITENSIYLDLESDIGQAKLTDPGIYLRFVKDHLFILDEVSRMPELFPPTSFHY